MMLLTCVSTTPDVLMRRMHSFAVSLKRQINCISTRTSSSLSTMSTSSSRAMEKGCPDSRTFQDAVRALNELQSNADVIKIITANRTALQGDSLPGTIKYLGRSGMELEELDQLNVIHVAGTKGKGSTCAFVESILRHAGLKTGFFSSPHLISVRERIRLNGKPISQEKFTRYFFQAYDGMDQHKTDAQDMPSYFRFLTCMAFKVFLDEKVDVAVIEVGIGGMYDSTNIVRKPVVTGITALGLDHQTILGETAEDIALQKAGIMKTGVPAITVPSHSPSVRKVLEDFANKSQSPLVIAPELKSYGNINGIKLGIGNADISGMNAALAIQLANAFVSQKFPGKFQDDSNKNSSVILGQPCPLQSWHLEGLKNCVWPGRFQVIRRSEKLAFYLDGAHTVESFDAALSWFREASPPDGFRTLVFHLTGFRKADAFLEPFVKSRLFRQVIFCPIVLSSNVRPTSEIWSKVESEEDLRQKCEGHAEVWKSTEAGSVAESKAKLEVLDSLESMLNYAESLADEKFSTTGKEVSILVTGSLHLVGTFLSLIDPHSCD